MLLLSDTSEMQSNVISCANCGKSQNEIEGNGSSIKSCSRCQAIAYCSKECQSIHWSLSAPIGHQYHCIPYEETLNLIAKNFKRNEKLLLKKKNQQHQQNNNKVSNEAKQTTLANKIDKNDMNSSIKCAICLNSIKQSSDYSLNYSTLPCSHSFHNKCLSDLHLSNPINQQVRVRGYIHPISFVFCSYTLYIHVHS